MSEQASDNSVTEPRPRRRRWLLDGTLAVVAIVLSLWAVWSSGPRASRDLPVPVRLVNEVSTNLTIRIDGSNVIHMADQEFSSTAALAAHLADNDSPTAARVVASKNAQMEVIMRVYRVLSQHGVQEVQLSGHPATAS